MTWDSLLSWLEDLLSGVRDHEDLDEDDCLIERVEALTEDEAR